MPGKARTGGSHRSFYLLSIHYGGMAIREGERREILRFAESRPVVFTVAAPFTLEV